MNRRRGLGLIAGLLTVVPLLVSCGNQQSASTVITVYAASSLTGTFQQLGEEFEAEHDGVRVQLNFAGSADLVAQIEQGADADVIATADTATMARLQAADLLDAPPVVFASNTLEIAVPPDNPAHITGLADLTQPGLQLVVCAPEVPCGAAAERVARTAGVRLRPVSEEQSVGDVLNKVAVGEADAGLVYRTDVLAAGDRVRGVPFAEADTAVNDYPIATLAGSDQAELAEEFAEFVLGPRGRRTLRSAGFGAANRGP